MVLFFSQDFKKIENCADNVKSSFGKIASLAVTGDAGRSSQGSLLANGAKYNITWNTVKQYKVQWWATSKRNSSSKLVAQMKN